MQGYCVDVRDVEVTCDMCRSSLGRKSPKAGNTCMWEGLMDQVSTLSGSCCRKHWEWKEDNWKNTWHGSEHEDGFGRGKTKEFCEHCQAFKTFTDGLQQPYFVKWQAWKARRPSKMWIAPFFFEKMHPSRKRRSPLTVA